MDDNYGGYHELYDDPRHMRYIQIARELDRRVAALQAPESIYDWLRTVTDKLAPPDTSKTIMDWPASFEMYDAEIERRIALSKLPESERKLFNWPWPSWNNKIDPIEPGLLAIIAGPDGSGKTTYCENIAEYWARRGQKVAFVHFELSKIIMLDRRAVRHTAIARRQLKLAGELTKKDMYDLKVAKEKLLSWPGKITYLHTPGKSIELVIRDLAKLHAAGQCDIAVVDYLEKATSSANQLKAFGANQFQREANDVDLLKNFSEEYGVPMLLLSQFSKSGKATSFADLDRGAIRGAGEKSEKANVVVLLQPDKTTGTTINLKLDKNTLGPKGTWQQFINLPQFLIGDIA